MGERKSAGAGRPRQDNRASLVSAVGVHYLCSEIAGLNLCENRNH